MQSCVLPSFFFIREKGQRSNGMKYSKHMYTVDKEMCKVKASKWQEFWDQAYLAIVL